jgi:hypothetical protein
MRGWARSASSSYPTLSLTTAIGGALTLAATGSYFFVLEDFTEARATATRVTSTLQPEDDKAVSCLIEDMETNVDNVKATDIFKDAEMAEVRPTVMLKSYSCNGIAVGYLLTLVLVTYGAAALAGLLVYILEDTRTG